MITLVIGPAILGITTLPLAGPIIGVLGGIFAFLLHQEWSQKQSN